MFVKFDISTNTENLVSSPPISNPGVKVVAQLYGPICLSMFGAFSAIMVRPFALDNEE